MFFSARRYPTYEAPLTGNTAAAPAKQYIPKAWAGSGKKYVFAKEETETQAGYDRWEKTTVKFFEMFKWLYEYMGKGSNAATPGYWEDPDGPERPRPSAYQTYEIDDK